MYEYRILYSDNFEVSMKIVQTKKELVSYINELYYDLYWNYIYDYKECGHDIVSFTDDYCLSGATLFFVNLKTKKMKKFKITSESNLKELMNLREKDLDV